MQEFLDALARSLAYPMPRRQALRVFGGALIGLVVPALSRRAVAQPERALCTDVIIPGHSPVLPCPSGQKCCQAYTPQWVDFGYCMMPGETCCPHVWGNSTSGYTAQTAICAPGDICQTNLPPGEVFYPQVCITCPSEIICGQNCCNAGETCAIDMCCPLGQKACGGTCCLPGAPCQISHSSICCPIGTHACPLAVTLGYDIINTCCEQGETCCAGHCCGAEQTCRNRKRCDCGPGFKACGTKCCTTGRGGQYCCGQSECCTSKSACCDGKCCAEGETCIAGLPSPRNPKPRRVCLEL
jgi:hypothetical protein